MKTLLTALVLATLTGGVVCAQNYEFGVSGSYPRISKPPLGSISTESGTDNDAHMKGQFGIGAWIGLNTRGYYGHEFNYRITYAKITTIDRVTTNDVLTTTTLTDRVAIHRAGYNFLIYFMPNGSRWRPFITGGIHAAQYQVPNFTNWPGGSGRHYGANYGGGIKLIPFPHALFRIDLRDYVNGKPYNLTFPQNQLSSGIIHQYEGSAGFAITF